MTLKVLSTPPANPLNWNLQQLLLRHSTKCELDNGSMGEQKFDCLWQGI